MEIGIDSFVATIPDPKTGRTVSPTDRMAAFLDEVETADRVGLDSFGVGEHHRKEFLDSAPAVILAAAAARTERIRLTSAVTVLSAADPVRVFQDFATVDLISKGRMEIVVGRGSFTEAFPLFGLKLEDYDDVFVEKLDLLLRLRDEAQIDWEGQFRPALKGQKVFPRPQQDPIPIWLGVGGTPESFIRAGLLGLPLMVAIIGGSFEHFRPLIDLYREAGLRAGHAPGKLKVGIHAFGFVGDTTEAAKNAFFPGWAYMMTSIGRERGWAPAARAQFETLCSAKGAYLIGDAKTVVQKILAASETLGGVSRFTLQMSSAMLDPRAMQRSIELLGTEVAPRVKESATENLVKR
jgi:probable LLM family oxidoreductase